MMKRIFLLVLALMLLVCGASAEGKPDPLADLYELSGDDTVLTVRMPASEVEGCRWEFEISNPDLMELITAEEYEEEELSPEGTSVLTGEWAGSFKSASQTEGMGGSVSLTLRNVLTLEDGAVEPTKTYVLDIWVLENGQLEVTGVRALEPDVSE